MKKDWRHLAPLAIVGIALFIFIGGMIIMLLWNWLLPPLFGVPAIGFWKALGILVLCRILFGGHAYRHSGDSKIRRRIHERMRERRADWERFRQWEREHGHAEPDEDGQQP